MQNIEVRVGRFGKKHNLNTKNRKISIFVSPKKSSAEMAWIFNPETFGSGFLVVSRHYSRAMSWWIDFLGSFFTNLENLDDHTVDLIDLLRTIK